MHRHSYSLLRYGQTVYTSGAAHSRPQAEAEEMKKDLETMISLINSSHIVQILTGGVNGSSGLSGVGG